MENRNFPKVLIIGNSFNETSGAGVTLTNLFKEWPRDRIAVASNDVNIDFCEQERPCHSYFSYTLNSELSLVSKKKNYNLKRKGIVFRLKKELSRKLGVSDIKKTYTSSKSFLDFYDKFNPQIIYSALGNIGIMRHIIELKGLRKFILALHIWDDFIGRYNYRYFPFLWKIIGDAYFKKILAYSGNICLSIGDKMSQEYKKRYGYTFEPFHNPVDPICWPKKNGKFCDSQITYTGKINENTKNNLLNLSMAIDKLNLEGKSIKFCIYTPDNNEEHRQIFSSYRNTIIISHIPQREIPSVMVNSKFLFLPLGFDNKSIKYTHLSIPTKLTEYMISGTPILLNCPKKLALYEYLNENNAAIITGNSSDDIYKCLREALNNEELCLQIAENAREIAVSRHSTKIVRDKFRELLLSKLTM